MRKWLGTDKLSGSSNNLHGDRNGSIKVFHATLRFLWLSTAPKSFPSSK